MSEAAADSMRIDLWLWAARFCKTRAIAQRLIQAGRVSINGQAISKPARCIQVGDQLHLVVAEQQFELQVLGLAARRGPASAARLLYQESEASRERRAAAAELRRLQGRIGPARRPEGRDRRTLRGLKEGGPKPD